MTVPNGVNGVHPTNGVSSTNGVNGVNGHAPTKPKLADLDVRSVLIVGGVVDVAHRGSM